MYGKGAIMFATWSYVIAHTKPDNLVELNPVMLASTFGQCTPEDVEQAIETLCSPDPLSRSKKLEGRRLIKKGEFMYFVVNADKYRTLPNDRERREYFAERQREHRERVKACQTGMSNESNQVKDGQPISTQYSDSESVLKKKKSTAITDQQWLEELASDTTYKGIDVKREYGKCSNWYKTRNQAITRRKFIGWLNRADKPMRPSAMSELSLKLERDPLWKEYNK